MSIAGTLPEIDYPESDGQPMAESEVHLECMFRIRSLLKWRYHGQGVYVGANLLLYYVRGNPRKVVAPDNFVARDCDPGERRTFKVWEEGRAPDVVIEVTSSSTRRQDEVKKPRIYARMRVKELFLFDPLAEYLGPPLQGFRFVDGKKMPILPDATGALESQELGVRLRVEDGDLEMYDIATGERLLTGQESAEEEVRRLRAEIARLKKTGGN
jgi:Uma2 family endonuclease